MSNLPAAWKEVSLASLAEDGLFVDGDWVESKDQDRTGKIRLTQLADVGVGVFRDRSDRWLRQDQADRLAVTSLEAGDILIARMPDPLGRACEVPALPYSAITVVDVAILRITREDIERRWVMWYLNSPSAMSALEAVASGTTRRRVSRKNLGRLPVPVPPLAEQRAIVNLLEDHLSRLEAALAGLSTIQVKADHLVESLVASAFRGVFDRECRRSEMAEIALGALGRWVTGSTPSTSEPDYYGGAMSFVTPGDLGRRGSIVESQRSLSATGVKVARVVAPPSVLLVCIGATLGKVAACHSPVVTNQQINSLEVDQSIAVPEYVMLLLSGRDMQQRLWASSSSTTVPIVNKGALQKITLPLPALHVQRATVERVDAIMASLHQLTQSVSQAETFALRLKRSLLHAAFTGELTKTWRAKYHG